MSESFSGDSLTCIRGERLVFAGLSFTVGVGDALVLRGPNGSGKSSLLRLMAGLAQPVEGVLRRAGWPVHEDPAAHRAKLRYLGHRNALKPALTARENLEFVAALFGGGKVDAALERLRLGPLTRVPARFLSSGEQRRLALARLIAAPAPLWLLDEPTVGLDDSSLQVLTGMIADHREAGGMLVMATHGPIDLKEAGSLDMTEFAVARPGAAL
jgi:heme exporter protein A